MRVFHCACAPSVQDIGRIAEEMIEAMQSSLADDLNPQPAITSLYESAKKVNELCYTKKVSTRQCLVSASEKKDATFYKLH